MKRTLQIVILVSGIICALSACTLCGIYASRLIKRLKYTYDNISNCFKPIDYIVEDYE